jgi:hypothetical protein
VGRGGEVKQMGGGLVGWLRGEDLRLGVKIKLLFAGSLRELGLRERVFRNKAKFGTGGADKAEEEGLGKRQPVTGLRQTIRGLQKIFVQLRKNIGKDFRRPLLALNEGHDVFGTGGNEKGALDTK